MTNRTIIRPTTQIAIAALIALGTFATAPTVEASSRQKGDKASAELTIPPRVGPKKRLAIAPMDIPRDDSMQREILNMIKDSDGIKTVNDVGLKLTTMLTTALVNSDHFVVLERQDFGDAKDEMALTAEYGTKQTQVKKGNVLGAQMIVRASVTEFAARKSGSSGGVSFAGLSIGGGSKKAGVTIDLKFMDPNTSQVLYTAKAEGTSESKSSGVSLSLGSLGIGGSQSKEQPIERATRNAIDKAVVEIIKRMAPLPWEARVVKAEATGVLTLNRGSQDGLQVGETYSLYAPGETITDPDTGEVLGRDEDKAVGTVTISWLGDRVSRATFSGPKGKLTPGMIIKKKG